MVFPPRMILSGLAFLLLMSCHVDRSEPSPTSTPTVRPAPASTELPLQRRGLAIGGDVQSRATDVIAVAITEEDARAIAGACGDAVDVVPIGGGCTKAVKEALAGGVRIINERCRPHLCLIISVYAQQDAAKLDGRGYVEIADRRPGATLCRSDPNGVCFRLGVSSSRALEQVTTTPEPTKSSEARTASPTTAAPTTTSTSPTPTDSSSSSTSTPSPGPVDTAPVRTSQSDPDTGPP